MTIFARHAALYTANELARVTNMTTTARRAALYNHELLCVANMTRRAARYTHELLRVTNMTTTARRARAIPVLRCAFSCSFWAARCVIIPGCVPFNYLPEWQHLAHTKVLEPVRRLTSRVTSANSCRRFTPVASLAVIFG